ncbi:hypothetical protein SPFM12_00304 [Salmonella phage SPFM12]|nr:hypothetical protein SPFM12_00304 [Salmonella phage SPFM12]
MFLTISPRLKLFYKGDEVYVVNSHGKTTDGIEEESGYDPDNQISTGALYAVLKGARPGDRSVDELIGAMSIEFTDVQEQSQWINGESVVMAIIVYTQEELQQVELEPGPFGYGTPPEKLGWYKPSPDSDMVLDTNSRIPDAVASIRGEIINCNAREFISYVLDNKGNAISYLRQLFPNLIIPDLETVEVYLSDYCSWSHRLYKSQVYAHIALNPGLKRVAPDVPDPNTMREALKMLENERFDIVVDDEKYRIITEHEKVRIGDRKSRVFQQQ